MVKKDYKHKNNQVMKKARTIKSGWGMLSCKYSKKKESQNQPHWTNEAFTEKRENKSV
ncbi:hypothetical protein TanjilG_06874 [Lupinus angustifolius]|uniref:Uncharacterized protein n=1 Tax=Lupinus angustifolius TaxID=3871 RepID=A0A4P1RS75_LUPAN|nr:hypothetical protein TanjilG_06874 [Lupinus angustifolius]